MPSDGALRKLHALAAHVLVSVGLPIGSLVVPFYGSYLETYKVIPKRNYDGANGYYHKLFKTYIFCLQVLQHKHRVCRDPTKKVGVGSSRYVGTCVNPGPKDSNPLSM